MIVKYRADKNDIKNYNPGKDRIVYSAKFIGGTPVLPGEGETIVFHNCTGDVDGKPIVFDLTCEVIGKAEHHMWARGAENAEEIQAIIPVRLLRVTAA